MDGFPRYGHLVAGIFISGLTEFGILDLMDRPKKHSFALPVPSLEAVELIAKVISSRCVFVNLEEDFLKQFFTDWTPLSAKLLLCGW